MAQLAILDIDGNLLLFSTFQDIDHVTKKDKAYPRVFN
jgi:hypothetical protein